MSAPEQGLLNHTRVMSRCNVLQAVHADTAPPSEASGNVDEWQEWGDGYGRMYIASTREVGKVRVQVLGVQHVNDHVERSIHIDESDDLAPADARQLAVALVEC